MKAAFRFRVDLLVEPPVAFAGLLDMDFRRQFPEPCRVALLGSGLSVVPKHGWVALMRFHEREIL